MSRVQTFSQVSKCHQISHPGSPRITRDDLKTLKSVETRKPMPALVAWKNFQSEMQIFFAGLAKTPKKTHNMCQNYGHVIRGKWSSYLPKCADCGITINSPDELRKSEVRTLKVPETQAKKSTLLRK